MCWLKMNWGWIVVIFLGLIPLTGILRMINIDFTESGASWITMDSLTVPGRRPGELPREISGAHMAVKETGEWAIRWVVIVLSLTPFSILTGVKSRLHVRQAIGITAFVYAFLHLLFFCIDKGLMETFKETGTILGLIAALIMMLLAITSNRRSMRFLRKTWKKIHRMAYLAGILAVLHVALLEHDDWIPYLIILLIGFLLRLPFIRQEISEIRMRKMSVPA